MRNRKIIVAIAIGVLIVGCSVFKPSIKTDKDSQSAVEIVKTLSSDEFEGRKPGTPGMEKACLFVESYFEKIGVEHYFDNTFRDSLTVHNRTSCNIVGKISASEVTNDYILIGAHLDHLGKTRSQNDSVYNGANDNATGVSAVLKIANDLKQRKLSKNIILTIFTEEESGLKGAIHLAKRLKGDGINLRYVINFEMLGKPLISDASKIYITGFRKSNFAEVANKSLGYELIKYESIEDAYGLFQLADNYPFYRVFNIPSHTLSTYDFKNFEYYHDVKDEFEEIDTLHLEQIIDKCSAMILELLENDAVIKLNN